MLMNVEAIDHIVLTVKDIDATCSFYMQVLGMSSTTFGGGRKALMFGVQKINLHQYGLEFEPKAKSPTPGRASPKLSSYSISMGNHQIMLLVITKHL